MLAERDETTGRSGNRRLVHSKSRVGEEGPIAAFELRDATIGTGDDGEPIIAGYVAVTSSDGVGQPAKKPRSELAIVLKAYRDAYARLADGVETSPGFDGAPVRKVKADAIRDDMKSRGFLDVDDNGNITTASRQRLRRAKDEMLTTGGFVEADGMVWRTNVKASEGAIS